jgi:hypothetical protein
VLPFGVGWSLWIHLFVQYPKTVSAVVLALVLLSVPAGTTDREVSGRPGGRRIVCAFIPEAVAVICPRNTVELPDTGPVAVGQPSRHRQGGLPASAALRGDMRIVVGTVNRIPRPSVSQGRLRREIDVGVTVQRLHNAAVRVAFDGRRSP